MLGNYLIGLREGLEAALIVSILISYVGKLGRRDVVPRMIAGVVLAVVLSLAAGAFLYFGAETLTFQAQEALGGSLSIVAVGFVTWMIFWMTRHGRTMAGDLRADVDRSLLGGGWGVALLAFLTVGREGLETALIVWSSTRAADGTALSFVAVVLGILTAVVVGVLLSKGLVRIDLSKFFTITGAFLIIVAAGVLSYGVHDLQEAGILPGLNVLAFDLSGVVASGGIVGTVLVGTILKGFVNFSPNSTWLELSVWVTYVAVIGTAFVLVLRQRAPRPVARAVPAVAPAAR